MDDAASFRALFEATYGPVRRYVDHRGVTGGRADDIVAETFVVAWRRFDQVPADRPLPWLLTVARNLWLNQRRGDRRYEAVLQRLPRPLPVPPPGEPPDDELAAVRAALLALDPADREVLGLVAWDGLSAVEVGEVLGLTPGAVRVRLHRARHRLRAELVKRRAPGGHDGMRSVSEGAER
jgi:RNA polymerase sigma-70 factor (ECF subfamily)